jgi:hypothetical protein
MEINLSDLKSLLCENESEKITSDDHPYIIGKKYFIRTVTMYNAGELVAVYPNELVLKGASWVADSGRFSEALKNPENWSEVEPFPEPVIVGRGAIIDATIISHVITEVK